MKTAVALIFVVALPWIGRAQSVGGSARNYNQGIDPGIGSGADPCNWNTNTGYSSEIDAMKVTYNVTTGGTVAETSIPPGRICGVGLTQRKKDDVTPLAPNNPDTISSCQLLYNKSYSYDENALWEKCYDTARLYVDRCASDWSSFNIFGLTDNAVQHYPLGDTTRYRRYREWLESVLYLNTSNPQYFCTCVHSISGTFYQSSDTTHELILEASNRTLAVIRWLIIHTACDSPFLAQEYADARRSQHDSWLSGDTTIPLDTTLPSMHDLGLDSLLNLHLGVGLSKSLYAGILSSFTISKNPFTSTTTLHFDLDRMVYMRVEVYDELGRIVTGDGSGYSYEPGKHQIPIDLKGFASGAYYLRISLGDGEVRTMKMVKKD